MIGDMMKRQMVQGPDAEDVAEPGQDQGDEAGEIADIRSELDDLKARVEALEAGGGEAKGKKRGPMVGGSGNAFLGG